MAALPPSALTGPTPYRRRRPERTLLYRTVQSHLETWLALRGRAYDDADAVPGYVEHEFRRYLECGILAHGFARARCAQCGHDFLIAFSCKGRGVCLPISAAPAPQPLRRWRWISYPLQTILDVREAIRAALARAQPGDLIVVGCAGHLSDLRNALAGRSELGSVDIAAFGEAQSAAAASADSAEQSISEELLHET